MNDRKFEPSPFARMSLAKNTGAPQAKENTSDKNFFIRTFVVLGIIAVVAFAIIGSDRLYHQKMSEAYGQGYNDAWKFVDDNIYGPNDSTQSSNQTNGPQGYTNSPQIQYAIASADPAVLWGLYDPYADQMIGPQAISTGTPSFGIPLTACTVYLVTISDNGQQAIAPVPTDQIPSQYLQYVSGCDPTALTPWWVSDQFALKDPRQLPQICGQDDQNLCEQSTPGFNS